MQGSGLEGQFEFVPHTADIAARLRGPTLPALFEAAAAAFTEALTDRTEVRATAERRVELAAPDLEQLLVDDVCHNIAKFETFEMGQRKVTACVHRKGSTRAYPPGHRHTPEAYRDVGQPVLIPGDMGRYSYVLAGTERAYAETFGSTCHGAGRPGARRWLALGHFRWRSELTMYTQARLRKRPACRRALGRGRDAWVGSPSGNAPGYRAPSTEVL